MNWKARVRQRLVGASLGTAFALLAGLVLYYLALGNALIDYSYDLPFALRRTPVPTNAVIIYLDDESHRAMNQPFNAPWDRAKHAELVERLTKAGAAAVVFDILFTDESPVPGADAKFRDAIKANGKVVLGGEYVGASLIPWTNRSRCCAMWLRAGGWCNLKNRNSACASISPSSMICPASPGPRPNS